MASIHQVQATSGMQWQNTLRARLMARQEENDTHRELIEQYQRLSKTVRELKKRNTALLRGGVGPSTAGDGPNPLLAHLDEQINELKNELAAVYRTQAASQNKQLTLSDALRDRDEEVRGLREEVRELREARDGGVRRERDWEDRWKARTKDMEVLNDELLSLNLELTTVSQRNNALQADNASLLQRWIDKMNLTAEEMNDEFEKESGGAKGKGRANGAGGGDGPGAAAGDFRAGGKAHAVEGAAKGTPGNVAGLTDHSGGGEAEGTDDWDIVVPTAPATDREDEQSSLATAAPPGKELDESSVLVEADFGRTDGDADDPDDGWDEARREA